MTNFSWGETNWCERYFQLGTMEDGDNDGLTDAYEQLVSHTGTNIPNSPRAIYEGIISNQNPSGWFQLNDGLLTNAISGRASLTNNGGGFENHVFATANGAYAFANSTDRLVLDETNDPIGGGTNDAVTQGSFTLLFKALTVRTTNGTSVLPKEVHMNNPAETNYSGWGATNVTLYFKAGCYYPTAATNSGTAKVTFSSLTATHQP
jgi:hypothetical protein